MKILMKTCLLLFMVIGFGTTSFAQTGGSASASAATNATIVAPITIANTAALEFGNIAVSATNPGTVTVSPSNIRSATDGVSLPPSNPGTVHAATFDITGENYNYGITLPENDVVFLTNGGANDIEVNLFTSDPDGSGTISGGISSISVGATLTIEAAQPTGSYTNAADLVVTIVYE